VNGNALTVLAILNGTAFYVLGICLASLALIVTAVGLRDSNAFSSSLAARLGALVFLVLVLATTTFAVRYSRNEQSDRRAKLAAEEKAVGGQQTEQGAGPTGSAHTGTGGTPTLVKPKQGAGGGAAGKQSAAKGSGGTVKLSADPTQIAFTTKSLSSKPGKVTIDFTNPSSLQHDVAIAQGSKQIAVSKLITQSSTSVSADLTPGNYVFFCTVPGHREAGMEGTLTVK
jgi:plastocyanin/membrane protein implicated in regulation of membrane protease activity